MSYYYKYRFVSPEPLFARVKEELKSYFDTGSVDDLMFPIWSEKCLKKMGKSSYKIVDTLLFQDNFQAKLPPDFVSVREVWLTSSFVSGAIRRPGAYYQQITTVLNKPFDPCNPALNCDPCNPDILTVTAKTTSESSQSVQLKYLLKPGNLNAREQCHMPCMNYSNYNDADVFDIRDGKLVTTFREGDVFLIYYSNQTDESGYQLIPDNYRIQEFIEAFIKQKVFEQLSNQLTDETFNQIQGKFQMYKQMADEAYIMADIESKKKTIYEKAYAIRRDQHRFDKYNAGMYNSRWGRRGFPSNSWGFDD